ncbi:cytochrome c, partial [Thioclava sp. BHET1]
GAAPAGEALYDAHCSTCHAADGQGGHGLPALLGNAALKRPTADNVAMAIMEGLSPTKGQVMPAFGNQMDNGSVATLTNFLFKQFGDAGVHITPDRVAELRAGGKPSDLIGLAKTGIMAAIAVLILIVLGALLWLSRRRTV